MQSVRVNLRTGKIHHTPPKISYEGTSDVAQALKASKPLDFSLTDSLVMIEDGLRAGVLPAQREVMRGWRRLQEQLERQEEELLLEEELGLA